MPERNRILDQTGHDIVSEIDPATVKRPAENLADTVDDPGPARCRVVAAIHDHVANEVDYTSERPGFTREPVETWLKGGNCVDQSLLTVSLLEAIGLSARLVAVGSADGERGHMLTQVHFDVADQQVVMDALNDYYGAGLASVRAYACERLEDELGYWFVADPEMSSYVGDIQGLLDQGYIRQTDDGGWEWTNRERVVYDVDRRE